jgi:hypothetical protein
MVIAAFDQGRPVKHFLDFDLVASTELEELWAKVIKVLNLLP